MKAWAESLGGITYPLLSDFYPHGAVARAYGVLRSEGYSERAIFVIDKYGVIRYVDVHDIDEQPDNEVLFRVLAGIDPQANYYTARAAAPKPPIPPYVRPDADLIMFCTPWCPECRRARMWLRDNNIPYVEIDVTKDRSAAQQIRQWNNGNETTPTFDVKGTIVVQFKQNRIAELLGVSSESSQ